MKSLDETIFEAPYTMTPWEENAIYYLEEYRDHMKNEIIELQEEVKKQKEMIEFLEKPLTWDELRTMEGKPVWVEEIGRKYATPHWAVHCGIMDGYDGDENLYLQPFEVLTKYTIGKTWQAYRKEQK